MKSGKFEKSKKRNFSGPKPKFKKKAHQAPHAYQQKKGHSSSLGSSEIREKSAVMLKKSLGLNQTAKQKHNKNKFDFSVEKARDNNDGISEPSDSDGRNGIKSVERNTDSGLGSSTTVSDQPDVRGMGKPKMEQTKRKKIHKKKAKTDGLSNWKKLCSDTLHINPTARKSHLTKRPAEPTDEAPETKRPKPEVWFDNVDEIFLEQPATSETAPKPEDGSREKAVNDKLVKAGSYTGLTNCVAMDCEMVGTGPNGDESILARVSIVNHYGMCLYDKFVLPREEVTDYRTFVSGITEENLATGEEFTKVQKEVSDILRGRVLVGHAVHNDLKVLFLTHPHSDIRDTSKYKPFRELFGGRIPALKKLSDRLLNVQVQEGQHSSVQDAQATMRLYTMFRQRWEKELKGKIKSAKKKNSRKKKKLKKIETPSS